MWVYIHLPCSHFSPMTWQLLNNHSSYCMMFMIAIHCEYKKLLDLKTKRKYLSLQHDKLLFLNHYTAKF